MRLSRYVVYILILMSASLGVRQNARAQGGTSTSPSSGTTPAEAERLLASDDGVKFTPNRGQIIDTRGNSRPDILYTVSSRGASLFLASSRISYVFAKDERTRHPELMHGDDDDTDPGGTLRLHRMDMELIGANPAVRIGGEEESTYYTNYYLSQCPGGITHVPSYRRLVYHDLYANVDMVLHGTPSGVKCDFIVRPGGRVSDIRIRYLAGELALADDGSIRATTPLGYVDEDAPLSYQEEGPEKRITGSRYRLDEGIITFDVGSYDHTRTLVIDPQRKWATYYGGSNIDNLNGGDPTEVDRSGSVLITGWTRSTPFPTSTGAFQTTYGGGNSFGDAFVVKFNGNGGRLWATYYGGSGDEISHGIASDVNRNIFITGHTQSTNLPVSSNAYQGTYGTNRDAFVVKFDSNGTRLWGTYYGGGNFDDGYGFGVDSTGNVAVLVTSASSGLQTSGMQSKPTTDSYDILMGKFSPSGSRLWATYIGGNDIEYGYAAASDIDDNIILTGWTRSTDFPTTSGAVQTSLGGQSDAFVAKFNSSGILQWSTYYGGSGTENEDFNTLGYCGIATDGRKNIFIAGHTTGNFPTTTGAFQTTYGGGSRDAFIVKFSPTGTRLWSTYFGGNGEDVGVGCASSPINSVLATGFTTSNNLPVTADAYQATLAGNRDVFIVKLDSSGARQWITYYGGTGVDEGEGISFDPFGSMVVAGHTASTNFPVVSAYQNSNAGSDDAFALLFCDIAQPKIDSSGPLTLCWTDSVILSVPPGYSGYLWNSGAITNRIVVKASGSFFVRVTNSSGCPVISDTVKVKMLPKPDPFIFPNGVQNICSGDTLTLKVGPSQYIRYFWSTGDTTPSIRVFTSGTYQAIIIDSAGCIDTTAAMTLVVRPKPAAGTVTITPHNPPAVCEGDAITLTASTGSGLRYFWSTGERTQSIRVTKAGVYRVSIVNEFDCPGGSDSVTVTVYPKPSPKILPLSSTSFCQGDSVVLNSTPGFASYRWSTGDTSQKITAKDGGTYTLTVTDERGCTGSTSIDVSLSARPHPKLTLTGPAVFCEGDSVVLDPGPGFISFLWSTGETTPTIVVREAGKYSVTVSDASNCPGTSDTVEVRVKAAPKIELNGPVEVCANSTVDYTTTDLSGMKYTWTVSGGGGTIVSGAGTASISVRWGASGSGKGKVRVTVTSDSTGCSGSDELDVTIGTKLIPTVTASRSLILCDGDSVILDAGSGYQSYRWSNGDTTRKIVVRDTGTFTVTVSNASGCGGTSAAKVVRRNASPTPKISASKTVICAGQSATLDAGGGYSRYEWSSGQRTRAINVSSPGTYTVTVTDANGCKGTSAPFTLTVQSSPSPTINGPNVICLSATGTYSVAPGAGDSYLWNVTGAGGAIVGGQGTSSVTIRWNATGVGTVTLKQTTSAGCDGDAEPYPVSVGSSLTPKITAPAGTIFCLGDSITLMAPGGYSSYLWSTGETTSSIRVGAAGSYRVTVSDNGGCSGSDSIDVSVRQLPHPFIDPEGPVILCAGDSAVLTAASGYRNYEWSTGETTQQIVVRESGKYSVTAANEDGCRGASEPVEVFVNPPIPKPTITVNGSTLTSSSAVTYQWYYEGTAIAGATSQSYVATKPGHYHVTITDAHGCSAASDPVETFEASATVELAEYEAVPGESLKIPITLKGTASLDNVGAYNYRTTVRFFKALLYPTGSTPLGIEQGEDRIVTIEGRREAGMTDGPIGELEFIAALGDTLVTPLRIETFAWTDGKASVATKDGLVRIRPVGGWKLYLPDRKLTLLPVAPNPTAGVVQIVYETIEQGSTRLYVVDAIGRRVLTLVDAETTSERRVMSVDLGVLPSDVYFLVLQTPTGRMVQPLQVQH